MALNKKFIAGLFALLVTLVFAGIFIGKVVEVWPEIRQTFAELFRSGAWGYAIPAVFMLYLVFALKAYRWGIIMGPLARPGYMALFNATAIGFMGNCVLPGRLGEVIRAVVLGSKHEVSKSAAFATIIVERLFDILGLVGVFLIGIALLARSRPEAMGREVWLVAGFFALAALVGLGFIVLMRYRPQAAKRLAVIPFPLFPYKFRRPYVRLINSFISGLTVLNSLKQGAWILALSILHWAMMGVMVWITSLCFIGQGFEVAGEFHRFDIGFGGAFLVQALQAFAVALPQLPGFFGTHQVVTLEVSKVVLGVAFDTASPPAALNAIASSFAIVLWCISIFPVILLGFVSLKLEGLSLKTLLRSARRVQEETEESSSSSKASADG